MKAMVFAAGLGTRLKPFTDSHPKALAEICGRPILGLVIERLKSFGVDELVVNVHHFADQIVDYIERNDNFGISVHISDETSKLLDTGGGILAARRWLDGNQRFIVHNADILTDFDLNDMVQNAVRTDSDATLLVADRSTKRYLLFSPDNLRMKGWTNIETGQLRPEYLHDADLLSRLAFGGVHVISPRLFSRLETYASSISTDGLLPKFSITDFYITECEERSLYGYIPASAYHWHDIGKPESLAQAEKDFYSFLPGCLFK